jgi:hypothetical protein
VTRIGLTECRLRTITAKRPSAGRLALNISVTRSTPAIDVTPKSGTKPAEADTLRLMSPRRGVARTRWLYNNR